MLYELLSGAGSLSNLLSDTSFLNTDQKISRVRFAFSSFQLFIWLLLFLILFRRALSNTSPCQILLIFAAAITPMAIASSIMTRLDGSVGILMTGLPVLAIAAAARAEKIRKSHILFFGSSVFLFGMGRNEWTILFLVATGIVFLFSFFDKKSPRKELWTFLAAGTAGLFLGNLASYLLDPGNYIGGFGLIFFRGEATQFLDLGTAGDFRRLLVRLFMSFPTLCFLAVGLGFFIKHRRSLSLLLLLLPGLLFFGYLPSFLSDTFYSYRYFAPALICSTIAAVAFIQANTKPWVKVGIVILSLILIGQTVYFSRVALSNKLSVTDGFGRPVHAYFPNKDEVVKKAKEAGCVPVLPNWTKFSHPDSDFVIPSLGKENATKVVEKRGGTLCP